MSKLPIEKIKEVNDFAEFLLKKIDDTMLNEGILHLVSEGDSFNFLHNEPKLYSDNELIGMIFEK